MSVVKVMVLKDITVVVLDCGDGDGSEGWLGEGVQESRESSDGNGGGKHSDGGYRRM